MPYQVKVNFVDAFESHKHPRADSRPHLGKFVRKGTRVGTAVSVKQAVAGALATLRNMPATARVNPIKATAEAVELLDHDVHDEACCDLCSAGELCDKQQQAHDAKWDEGKHPRGQPSNAGQFAKGGAAGPSPHPQSKPQKEMHKIATGPGDVPEKVSAIKKVMQAYSVPKGGFAEKFGQQWIATLSEGVKEPQPAPPATPTAAPKAEHEGNITQTFNKQNLPASSLNGIPFQHWEAPKTNSGWNALAKQTQIDEPPLPKTTLGQAAGVIIQEDDGRVWIIHPTNAYGGYAATFPKGGVEKGMTTQATALKEAYEESGLQVELTGFAGDVKRTTSQARYYFAKRVGGTPVDAGWESESVTLAPVEELFDHLNVPRDQQMAANFLGASAPPPPKLSDMQKHGGQLGSNPGGRYKAANGKEYYVKLSKSDSHARNEMLASALYEAAGSPVLKAKLFDNDGKLATGTEWQSITPINRHDPKQREAAQKHFATHAWLANWDAAGLEYDNQGTAENGKMTTLDPGGSLLYRAQGGPKGSAFGDEVGEWDTLRDPNNKQAHTLYGSMTPEQLKKSASRVAMVPDSIIYDLTMMHGPGSESEKKALAKRIIARKYDIVKKAKALKVVPIPKKTGDSLHHVMLRVRY